MIKTFQLLLFSLGLFMTICCDKHIEISPLWPPQPQTIVAGSISFDYLPDVKFLDLHANYTDSVVATPSEDWISTTYSTRRENSSMLIIRLLENPSIHPRTGAIRLAVNDKVAVIKVYQAASKKVVLTTGAIKIGHEGGTSHIDVYARGTLTADIYDKDCNWAKILKVEQQSEHVYRIWVDVERNAGLGRLFAINVKANGEAQAGQVMPCVAQLPSAPFGENLHISTDRPGILQLWLGNSPESFKQVQSVKIDGPINRYDFTTIRSLLAIKQTDVPAMLQPTPSPIDVDLSKAIILSDPRPPFPAPYGWMPIDEYVHIDDGWLPKGVFTNAINLRSIRLPEELTLIGAEAFKGCRLLNQIELPDWIEQIERSAFEGCRSLTDIKISDDSGIRSIGYHAFSTLTWINSLTLPLHATELHPLAFEGCKVRRLHLKWLEPVEVAITPQVSEAIYVPKGTIARYRASKTWAKFADLLQEEE